ncbi:MAG: tRNA(Ile)(2)-agmatinylcytidine synthase [Methanosarcinales archaeon]|jgi:tRNA(Ile2)-agmatinylcytidine synthase|nr:tRNA(Ile)(2)-agmatinylcytidine synthase [Methanosarcinales archaeon]
MLIGIDDTDSDAGMCTTYLAALLADELKAFGTVDGFPYLIRLNPTVPYKTRGNAALGLSVSLFDETPETKREIITLVADKIHEYADLSCEKTNPGAVFIFSGSYNSLRRPLGAVFKKAVTDVIEIEEAAALLNQFEAEFPEDIFHFSLKNGRGLIGSLAACGAVLSGSRDSTFEYLAYRLPKNWGSCGGPPRFVDFESLISADRNTAPETWDTVDYDKKTKPFPVCVPRGNDPVLFGIRGESPEAVQKAAESVISEEIERFQIFQTNQGTDAHLIFTDSVLEMRPLHSYILEGTVCSKAETTEGGHDIFKLKDSGGALLECAAYEPTGNFRHVIRELIPGDKIRVYGSFKKETLNLEKIKILKLAGDFKLENPACSNCGKRMESAGGGQGFRCKKCKTTAADKIKTPVPRKIRAGYYEVPPSARRHLSKPLIRYSKEALEF